MSGSSSTTRTVASLTRGPSAARAHPSAITPFSTADRAVLFDVVMRATAYPKELEGDVELREGTRVHIRPIRPEDETRLVRLYENVLADNSRMLSLVPRFGDIRERTLQHGVVELLFTARAAPRAVNFR